VACARPENNNRAKDAKSSERAPLIVTPIRKPTADWDEGKLLWWLKFRLPNLTVGSTPAAEVRPSKTAGHGLFTTIEISAGALVSRVGGRLVGSAELDALLAQPEYVNTISVANGLHLVLPPRCPNGYGNHSSDPNLWWDGPYDLIARRPIRAGEELTNEYATSTAVDGFTMTCECCTSVCRGLVAATIGCDRIFKPATTAIVCPYS
jgi:uncharacterized protein